ncbi:MAG: AAA family ATPase [Bacteroidetes bacterium]|nr:AAA family ATPase [Bacteroidota bacterium]MBU1578589.1 AAA family ATPase [Bacteroidota bacterium]MBU2464761.1 AAA family ATPase [Bacteroidota bacterium]MBU2558047.1 AAA family ATPase [Bacteroidota bacterium]
MTDRIYLVGYMGAGKSTCARRLASKLGWESVDTDQLFETKYKIAIHDFFKKYDESLFRRLERDLLIETGNLKQTIIATGGGTPCFYNNISWMNENGLTAYLKMSPAAIANRLIHAKKKRPLILEKNSDDIYQFVKDHMRQRAIFYSQANLVIEAESLDLQDFIKQINAYPESF